MQFGDDDAFAFFNQGDLSIEVLGPFVTEDGGKPALRFLGNPPKGPRIGHESLESGRRGFKGLSASHTINGHSIVFRLVYGGFSYLFTGDLNDEASRFLTREHNAGRSTCVRSLQGAAPRLGRFFRRVVPGRLAGRQRCLQRRRKRAEGVHPSTRDADGRAGQMVARS